MYTTEILDNQNVLWVLTENAWRVSLKFDIILQGAAVVRST